jgi:hypothetical protein
MAGSRDLAYVRNSVLEHELFPGVISRSPVALDYPSPLMLSLWSRRVAQHLCTFCHIVPAATGSCFQLTRVHQNIISSNVAWCIISQRLSVGFAFISNSMRWLSCPVLLHPHEKLGRIPFGLEKLPLLQIAARFRAYQVVTAAATQSRAIERRCSLTERPRSWSL